MTRSNELHLRGVVPSRADAGALLAAPGDAVIVHREVDRLLVLRCPSDCGATLVLNLDRRAGKAWSLRGAPARPTLYPSVWLPNGCESHFIIAAGRILWCDYEDSWFWSEWRVADTLVERVRSALDDTLRPFTDLATRVDEDPWDVLVACRRLVGLRHAIEGSGEERGAFRAQNAR